MTENPALGFDSVSEFLAHAHALEQELAQRYEEMADSVEVHNNFEVATLFRQLTKYGETHAGKLIRHAQGVDLPKIPPWEYQWLCIEGLENCMEDIHYLMSTYQALELALRIEQASCRFYVKAMQDSPNFSVKKLASSMITIKDEHLTLLQNWLTREAQIHKLTSEDLDPPNMPE